MATVILDGQRVPVMASEGDGGWVSLVNLGVNVFSILLGGVGALFIRSVTWASGEGRNEGALHVWRDSVDAKFTAFNDQIKAVEARMEARDSLAESRKTRVDDKLDQVPTRSEMNEGFKRLERQVELLDAFVHRVVLPPPSN